MLVIQAVMMGGSVIPLFLLCRSALPALTSLAICFAYLIAASLASPLFYDFHWLPIAIPFLFLLMFALNTGRYRLAAVALLLALLMREDVALTLAVGATYFITSRRNVKLGVLLCLAGLTWFVGVKCSPQRWTQGPRTPRRRTPSGVSVCAERSLEPTQWTALFSKAGRLALTRAGVLDLRRAAWAGVARLEPTNPARVVRWLKVAGVVALVLVVAVLGYQLSRPAPVEPGLLAGKPFRLSSKLGHDPGNPKLLFHTARELSAWVEYDLQQPTQVKEVSVGNRSDCCGEAALPLVLEASDDQATWRELARRTEPFSRADFSFPPVQTRYLRLRVGRMSYLHLEAVGAR